MLVFACALRGPTVSPGYLHEAVIYFRSLSLFNNMKLLISKKENLFW